METPFDKPPESVWKFRPFMRLWYSRIAAAAGMQMLAVAIGWHVYEVVMRTTHDQAEAFRALGLVGLMQFFPRVALVFVVGTVVDRFDRRVVLGLSLLLQGVVAGILAVGSSKYGFDLGRYQIYALALAIGIAQSFTVPAMQALMPNVVPAKILPRAISAGASGLQGASIAAPAIGGLIYGECGAWTSYAFTAACFLSGMTLILGVPLLGGAKKPGKEPVTLASVFAGLKFMRARPDILGAVSLDLFAVLLGGATALMPGFADAILHLDSRGVGMLRSAQGAGALLMSIWLTRHPINRHVGRTMFGAVAVFGLATVGFGLAQSFWTAALALVVVGASDMVSVVIRSSFVQLETPDDMRGRVSAVNSLFIGASNELGEFESGMVAGWLGLQRAIIAGGAGTILVVGLWTKLFPTLAKRDHMITPDEAKRLP